MVYEWYGIELGPDGHVSEISLSDNNLNGTIPPEIGNLPALESLSLSYNQYLSGNIPAEIGKLTKLEYLNLSIDNLSGPVPAGMSNLSVLSELYLNDNQLSGWEADMSGITTLSSCYIYSNNFTFGDLEKANIQAVFYSYTPQNTIIPVVKNESSGKIILTADAGGTNTSYQWYDKDIELSGETNDTLILSSDANGAFICKMTNSDFPGLEMTSNVEEIGESGLSHGVYTEEYEALVDLYNATSGEFWKKKSGWLSDYDVSYWEGVTVENYHVNALYLKSNNLIGIIPATIGNLKKIDGLNLSYNELTGNIPPDIGNLSMLTFLSLGFNYLTGNIPPEIWSLTNLTYLYLDNNNFSSGRLPAEIGNLKKLEKLYLWNDSITGTVPAEIGSLTELKEINLRDNKIDSIPDEITVLNKLTDLDLTNNRIAKLPKTMYDLGNLRYLRVGYNKLDSLPNMYVLFDLSRLYVNNNCLDFGDFENSKLNFKYYDYSPQAKIEVKRTESSGKITFSFAVSGSNNTYQWYEKEHELTGETKDTLIINSDSEGDYYCVITDSKYPDLKLKTKTQHVGESGTSHGVYKEEHEALLAFYDATNGENWKHNTNWNSDEDISEWYGIEVENFHVTSIDLSFNKLAGTLPSEIGNFPELTTLDLTGNRDLHGNIPPEIGDLSKLKDLDLSWSSFSGNIPPDLGDLSNLISLDLSNNDLNGTIPEELGNLSVSKYLALSDNRLTGSIPGSFENLQNLRNLKLSNNYLEGSIPAFIGKLTNIYNLDLSGNQLSGAVPAELADITPLEYLYLNNNLLDELPDLSALQELYRCDISNNFFNFNDLENAKIYCRRELSIHPQADIKAVRSEDNTDVTLSVEGCATNNTYQWYINGNVMQDDTLSHVTISKSLDGIVYCKINNPDFYDLELLTITEGIGDSVLIQGVFETELRALKEFYNATGGDNWYRKNNWLSDTAPVDQWYGVDVYKGHVIELNLADNNINGSIPSAINDMPQLCTLDLSYDNITSISPKLNNSGLDELNLYGDHLTSLPDIKNSLPGLCTLDVRENDLTFEDVEPIIDESLLCDFYYSSQNKVGEEQNIALSNGSSYTLSVNVGGANNKYQWYKGDSPIGGATGSEYTISDFTPADAGSYYCMIRNTTAEDLILYSEPFNVAHVDNTYSVTFTVTNGTDPVPGAVINLKGYPAQTANSSGIAAFSNVLPKNSIEYTVTANGYEDETGTVSVTDNDVDVTVTLKVATRINKLHAVGLKLWPNPVGNSLTIRSEEGDIKSVRIVSINGRTVFERNTTCKFETLNLSSLPDGMYIVTVFTKNKVFTSKIIKK